MRHSTAADCDPRRLYLNQSNSRLYVSEWLNGGRIFVFDIRRR
jgi:hypothetical protein